MSSYSRFAVYLSVVCIAAVFVSGCGGNSSSNNAVTPSQRPSGVISGISSLSNGIVKVYTFTGQKGDLITTGDTDASGQFTLSVKNADVPVLICTSGGSYYEPASAVQVPGDGYELCAVGEYVSGEQLDTTISYYTHLSYALATFLTGQGESASQSVTDANQDIDSLLGFSASATIPVDISLVSKQSTGLSDGLKYGFSLAAISQYTLSVSQSSNVSTHVRYNSLSFSAVMFDDLSSDGVLDGKGDGGSQLSFGGQSINTSDYRHKNALAIIQATNNQLNVSGITSADIVAFAKTINDSTNVVFGNVPPISLDEGGPTTTNTSQSDVSGSIMVDGTVNDLLGLTSVEVFLNQPNLSPVSLYSINYPAHPSMALISVPLDTTGYDDCACTITFRGASIDGTIKDTTMPLQIDNIRFLYLRHQTTANAVNTTHLGVFKYNVSDGILIQVPSDIFNSSTGYPIDNAIVDPDGKYLYVASTQGNRKYDLDAKSGLPTTFSTVDFVMGVNNHEVAFDRINGSEILFTVSPTTPPLHSYALDSTGLLTANLPITANVTGVDPYLATDTVNHELIMNTNSGLQGYAISSKGTMSLIQNDTTALTNTARDYIFSSDGKYLYVLSSVAGTGGLIDVYSHNSDSTLTYKSSVTAAMYPKVGVLSHDDKHLYVLSVHLGTTTTDATIAAYDVDTASGLLKQQTISLTTTGIYYSDLQIDAYSDYLFVYADKLYEIPLGKTDGSLGAMSSVTLPSNVTAVLYAGSYPSSGAANAQ